MHGLSKCPLDVSDVLPAGWVSCEESGCGQRAAGLCAQCARKCCAPHSVFLRANFVCRWCESDGQARVARNFGKIKHRDAAVAATPIAACFDFAAAFPSVSHRWLFAILHHLEVPRGFIAFVGAIYSDNEAKYGSGRAAVTLFVIVAGILQGCPGSGSFFVVALEPFLWKFDCILKAQDRRRLGDASLAANVIRACADDIAFALCRLDTLVALKKVYDEAAVLSLLCLKPRKCVLVTVRGPPSPAHALEIRQWLARSAPGWESFQISGRAKYLGFMLGPEAAQAQWRAAVAKYDERTRMIAATGAPPSVTARLYASRAVPTMSYIWQLVPLATEVRKREIFASMRCSTFLRARAPSLPSSTCTSTELRAFRRLLRQLGRRQQEPLSPLCVVGGAPWLSSAVVLRRTAT